MDLPQVYVLILNWNGRQHLEECFTSLLQTTYPNVRFVLIDNASEDGSVEFVRERFGEDPRVEMIVCETNLGWSRGNNVGLERAIEAGADYAFLLNNDTATAADAVAKLVETAENQPRLGALAPKMLLYDSPNLINSLGLECSVIGSSWDLGIGRLDGARWNEPRPVIGVCGGAFFLRVAALERSGLLPTDYDIYLDDLELCMRLWNAGYEVWNCPEAVVRHKFGATMDQPDRQRRRYSLNTRNRMRMVLRNFPMGKWAQVAPALAVGEARAVGRALLDGEFWKVGVHARSWASAARYLSTARTERQWRKKQGLDRCRFWHLINRKRLFFQGVEFPENGWYASRDIRGVEFRPISSEASRHVQGGKLRVLHANCYPRLGATHIRVDLDGSSVATLRTLDFDETLIEVSGGTLQFTAKHIFEADQTGESADFGGWLRVEVV